jgi:hypothetical protein
VSTTGSVLYARNVAEQASVSTIGDVPNARSVVEQASVSTIDSVLNARSVVEEASVSTIRAYEPKAQAQGPLRNKKRNVNLDASPTSPLTCKSSCKRTRTSFGSLSRWRRYTEQHV